MTINTLPLGMLRANCYIVGDEESGKCAVIDPGADADAIMELVNKLGYTVSHILLTHGHFDHVMAAPKLKEMTGAQLCIHREDEKFLDANAKQHLTYIKEPYEAPQIDLYLEDGMEIKIGGLDCRVLNTPGHSNGCCIFLIQDAMFSGDTLFRQNCGRCDLEDGDYGKMLHSLARIARLEGDFDVYPGHERSSRLSFERERNPYMLEGLSK